MIFLHVLTRLRRAKYISTFFKIHSFQQSSIFMFQFTTTSNQAIITSFIFKSNSYESSFTDSNSIFMKMIKQLDENMTHVTQDQHALKEQMLEMQKELRAIKKNINEKVTTLAIKMKKSNNSSSDYSNRFKSSSRSQFERNRTERRRRRV